jgi:hypothetical protein
MQFVLWITTMLLPVIILWLVPLHHLHGLEEAVVSYVTAALCTKDLLFLLYLVLFISMVTISSLLWQLRFNNKPILLSHAEGFSRSHTVTVLLISQLLLFGATGSAFTATSLLMMKVMMMVEVLFVMISIVIVLMLLLWWMYNLSISSLLSCLLVELKQAVILGAFYHVEGLWREEGPLISSNFLIVHLMRSRVSQVTTLQLVRKVLIQMCRRGSFWCQIDSI